MSTTEGRSSPLNLVLGALAATVFTPVHPLREEWGAATAVRSALCGVFPARVKAVANGVGR